MIELLKNQQEKRSDPQRLALNSILKSLESPRRSPKFGRLPQAVSTHQVSKQEHEVSMVPFVSNYKMPLVLTKHQRMEQIQAEQHAKLQQEQVCATPEPEPKPAKLDKICSKTPIKRRNSTAGSARGVSNKT